MDESQDEIARRRTLVQAGETDLERWSQPQSFLPQWSRRAALAAQMTPAASTVLDIGCGAMDLERVLPDGCRYVPCDLVRRDDRTIICDLNRGEFPASVEPDVVTLLGVLEYIREPDALIRRLRAFNRPVVFSYSITDRRPDFDRASQGWINAYDFASLNALMRKEGFRLEARETVDPLQDLFKWVPDSAAPPPERRIGVLSYYNDPNFGDRLGYQIINRLAPPNAVVRHLSIMPWEEVDETFDLLIVGNGGSLNPATVERPEVRRLVRSATHAIGIFGTQYRSEYGRGSSRPIDELLSSLSTWWARYEEDILALGRGRENVRHLGDMLISEFPMARGTIDRNIFIPADFRYREASLDRIIQQIQSYRRVTTERLHTMLCALTSAESVRYREQREIGDDTISGKFRSQLYDVFGRTYPEDQFFEVNREEVIRYKTRVEANLAELRAQIAGLLV